MSVRLEVTAVTKRDGRVMCQPLFFKAFLQCLASCGFDQSISIQVLTSQPFWFSGCSIPSTLRISIGVFVIYNNHMWITPSISGCPKLYIRSLGSCFRIISRVKVGRWKWARDFHLLMPAFSSALWSLTRFQDTSQCQPPESSFTLEFIPH
jgi:hypothetical protein